MAVQLIEFVSDILFDFLYTDINFDYMRSSYGVNLNFCRSQSKDTRGQ